MPTTASRREGAPAAAASPSVGAPVEDERATAPGTTGAGRVSRRPRRGAGTLPDEPATRPSPLGRLRLAPELEADFCAYHFEQTRPLARLAIVLAVVLYALFGILDLLIVPDHVGPIWVVRYAVFCPLGLAVLAFSSTTRFRSVAQPVLCGLAMVCGLGIVAMVVIADPADGHLYYAGLLLVIPWAYTLLQLRFAYATVACAVIIAGYEVAAVWLNSIPADLLINNNFFFVSAVIIAMLAGYTIERGVRIDFLQRRQLEAQREELARRNTELDSALQVSLDEVRRQAGELQVSRARIVASADAERRRLERDLHDGAQQQLAALKINLGLARMTAEDEQADETLELIDQLLADADDALRTLRELAHGIYPPLLASAGLEIALRGRLDRLPLPARLDVDGIGRYPPEVEAAVYFCCLEALQNMVKYAQASTCHVRLSGGDGMVRFCVVDDGTGFDPSSTSRGAGLQNMADRLEALGGRLELSSRPGHGTVVWGEARAAC